MTNLFGNEVPASPDAADGISYSLGERFTPSVDGQATAGRLRFPNTIPHATTPVRIGIFRVSDQVLLGYADFPLGATLGSWNTVAFSPAIDLVAGVTYCVTYYTPLRYVATGTYPYPKVSGELTAGSANGWLSVNPGALVFPTTQSGNSASYFADLEFTPTASTTPVSTTLTSKWSIYGKLSSVFTGKWRIFSETASNLTAKWRLFSQVTSTLRGKWHVLAEVGPAPVNTALINIQRQMTQAFINDDPTSIELIPYGQIRTNTGGWVKMEGDPRPVQVVKMVELSYDQRPTVTVAGVDRQIDYHLVGLWNMQIAVGDIWYAEDGTTWEVLGFSEGWDYMTKAFIGRRVPREVRP